MPGLWIIAVGLAELLLLSHCSRSATPREAAAMNNSLETLGDLADLRPEASREAKAGSTRRPPRIHRTGRNHQFNAKATADTIRRFNAICDGQRWAAGLALEHLVTLAEAALRLGTIAEAIGALEGELARESRPTG
jgi:hypothetical protein